MAIASTLTTDDHVALVLHVTKHHAPLRKQTARLRLMSVGTVVIGLVVLIGLFQENWIGGVIFATIVGTIWWFVFPLLQRRTTAGQLRRLARERGGLGAEGPVRLSVDESGIREERTGTTTVVGWEAVERIDETDDYAFVFSSPLEAMILPRRAEGAPALLATIQARVKAAGS